MKPTPLKNFTINTHNIAWPLPQTWFVEGEVGEGASTLEGHQPQKLLLVRVVDDEDATFLINAPL